MDIEKLIERLRNAAGGPERIKMCQDAACPGDQEVTGAVE